MRLLITGGCGSLGSNVTEHLYDQCDRILIIDNFVTGRPESLGKFHNVEIVKGSITDRKLLNLLFESFRPTHVVHSAASYKDPNDWATDSQVNVLGTVNVVRASEQLNVRRFINFQTALCYGRPSTIPIPVDHPTRPFTSYGITKTAGEAFVCASSLSWVSLRIANVTGPRLAIGPLPTFYKKLQAREACTVSSAVRDFLDMTDFLNLIDLVLESEQTGIFNASTGIGHSIEEVFNLVASHLGQSDAKPAAIVHPSIDDVGVVVLDPSVTNAALGWFAKTSFEHTVEKMLRWYDLHGVTDVYSHLATRKS